MAERDERPLQFGGGEDHTAHETRIPEGFARRVVNWDLDDTGAARQRPGVAVGSAGAFTHSLWQDGVSGKTFVVSGNRLCTLQGSTYVPLQWATGGEVVVRSPSRMFYVHHLGWVYFTNDKVNGVLHPDGYVYPWGVHNLNTPVVDASANVVRYITYEDSLGRESGAVRMDTGTPNAVVGHVVREYIADEDGSLFRLNGTGRELTTQERTAFPPGRHPLVFSGRMLVVRGRKVYYSDPLNPGLVDPRYSFVDVGAYITAMGEARDGVYVGTSRGVVYLAGPDPDSWQPTFLSSTPVIMGGSCKVPLEALPSDLDKRLGERYAVAMLTEYGLLYCMDGGRVSAPTRDRIRLPSGAHVFMDTVIRDGYYQIIAVPQQVPQAEGEAELLPAQITEV